MIITRTPVPQRYQFLIQLLGRSTLKNVFFKNNDWRVLTIWFKIHWPIFRPFRVDRENNTPGASERKLGWKVTFLYPIQSMGLVYLPTFDYIWFIFDGKCRYVVHGCYGFFGVFQPLLVWGSGTNYLILPTTIPKKGRPHLPTIIFRR